MARKGKQQDKTPVAIDALGGTNKTKRKQVAQAVGAPFPNVNTFFSGKRIDVKLLEQTARAPPVARSLWQLQLIAFPWFDFQIVPPSGEELDPEQEKKVMPKLESLDRKIQTSILCAQAMYDVITYGSAIFEVTWSKDDEGYISPDVVQRLPAQSFRQAPPGIVGDRNRYVMGNILKGIVFDKADKAYQFWQLQNPYGGTALPTQIPTDQVIHIKDARSSYVDGDPYIAGIVSTIAQLEFVRKRMMQTMSRVGSPRMSAKVGIPPEYLKALEANGIQPTISSAVPGASTTPLDVMLTDLWEYARIIVEGQNSDQAIAYPAGIETQWERPSVPFNPTEIDAYLIKEAISHIFPRDILEVASQAISTTSAPLLELLKMMVQGWQSLCSLQFEVQIWNKFLELNGFDGYRVELKWADLVPPDDQKVVAQATQKFNLHLITLNEARAEIGMPSLEDAPWMEGLTDREILEKELAMWRQPNQPQPGFGGAPGFGGGEVPQEGMEGEGGGEMGELTPEEQAQLEQLLSEGDDLLTQGEPA